MRGVIVLHDVGERAEMHEGLTRALSESGYETYAPDCRGHGGTSASREGRYGVRDLSDDVEAFVVALDLYVRPVCLVWIRYGRGGGVRDGETMVETRRGDGGGGARRRCRRGCIRIVRCKRWCVRAWRTWRARSHRRCSRMTTSRVDVGTSSGRACRRATCTTTTTTTGKTRGTRRLVSSVTKSCVGAWIRRFFTYDVDAFRECVETNACHFALVYGERSSLVDHRTASLVVDAASRAAKTSRAYVVPEASRHITDDAFTDAGRRGCAPSRAPTTTHARRE